MWNCITPGGFISNLRFNLVNLGHRNHMFRNASFQMEVHISITTVYRLPTPGDWMAIDGSNIVKSSFSGHWSYLRNLTCWEREREREEHRNRKSGKVPNGWNTEMCRDTGIHFRTMLSPSLLQIRKLWKITFCKQSWAGKTKGHFQSEL